MDFQMRFMRNGAQSLRLAMSAALCLLLFQLLPSHAQSLTPIRIDASQPYREPEPAHYDGGSAKSPSGGTLAVNSRYLLRDGRPWLPVMGEFHFTRYPESRWEEEILKMKASGVEIVATYVIWIHHEEIEGQFDWKGRRDLRTFGQLCAKHGMYLEARIGPWSHAEVRNGGFPDWLLKKGPTRVNDPVYLSYVRAWYGQIAQQLKGQLWKDGGPVIGIQLENEYSNRGPGAGDAHILELKRLALESGLDVPLYFVTGWDNAVVPERAVLPVYGGYPDAPWDVSLTKLPPAEVYAFRFRSRAAANMGALGSTGASSEQASTQTPLPYLGAEIGAGIEDTYHRRPVIHPDDVGAMFPVMLGSGVNLYGSYMFQGGENPEGKLSTMQESQATGYPNDVPVKSYDFQAPLGEFGEERASFRKMKVFQYFLNDFGEYLAPMMVHAPDQQPANPEDFSVVRAAVRSRGDSGFIFLNNYVRNYSMPVRTAAQFEIRLPDGILRVPRHPLDLPSGAYFIWPFNLHSGGVTIRYSTAQLFTRIENGGATTLYFVAVPGIPVEFALDSGTIRSVESSSGKTVRDSRVTVVSGFKPGVDSFIELAAADGKKTRLVVLTEQEAENAWKVRLGGGDSACYQGNEHLLITRQDFFADREGQLSRIWLRSRGTPHFAFSITPPPSVRPEASLPLIQTEANARTADFIAEARERKLDMQYRQVQAAGIAPPVTIGPAASWRPKGAAQAPAEDEFRQAARWMITLPSEPLDGLNELYLQVKYQGDVARLYAGNVMLTDNFYNGQVWSVGLRRFMDSRNNSLELSVLPLRKDAPVYLELPEDLKFAPNGQIDRLDNLHLEPEYQLVLTDTGRQGNVRDLAPGGVSAAAGSTGVKEP
jgi:beta-galactosidase